jgi:hypothetical protein
VHVQHQNSKLKRTQVHFIDVLEAVKMCGDDLEYFLVHFVMLIIERIDLVVQNAYIVLCELTIVYIIFLKNRLWK